jgi:hypothetical protein
MAFQAEDIDEAKAEEAGDGRSNAWKGSSATRKREGSPRLWLNLWPSLKSNAGSIVDVPMADTARLILP